MHVCVLIPHCVNRKKRALKPFLSFWSLWWNLWRGTARGLFCFWAVGVLLIAKSSISPCITPWLFLTSDRRTKDMIFYVRHLYLPPTAPSKQLLYVCWGICLSGGGHGVLRFVCVCVCMFMFVISSRYKRHALTHHLPTILIISELSTSAPEGGSYQRAWFKSLGFKALGNDWTTLSHFTKKYSNLVHVRKSK